MKYEELVSELCEVIKETEKNASGMYAYLEEIENVADSLDVSDDDKQKVKSKVDEILALLQYQDLHRQKVERVVNFMCEKNDIDKSKYNLAPSAKSLDSNENMNEDELEALIKEMKS